MVIIMTANEIVELLEPKMPPINLWCLVPASWFYHNIESKPIEIRPIIIREDKTSQLKQMLRDR